METYETTTSTTTTTTNIKKRRKIDPAIACLLASHWVLLGIIYGISYFCYNIDPLAVLFNPAQPAYASRMTPEIEIYTPTPEPTPAYGVPVNLKIPKLGLDAKVESVWLTAQGDLGVPGDLNLLGWYNGSSRPGQAGSIRLHLRLPRPTSRRETSESAAFSPRRPLPQNPRPA